VNRCCQLLISRGNGLIFLLDLQCDSSQLSDGLASFELLPVFRIGGNLKMLPARLDLDAAGAFFSSRKGSRLTTWPVAFHDGHGRPVTAWSPIGASVRSLVHVRPTIRIFQLWSTGVRTQQLKIVERAHLN